MRLLTPLIALLFFLCSLTAAAQTLTTDVLIVGGGASGTTAGIQSARMGVKTLIIEETQWLGGMLTSAGVSAIDGNHNLPAGLWGEFRQKLYEYYGGPKAVETGWVSNTLFEPATGNKILQELARNPNLSIWYNTTWKEVKRSDGHWKLTVISNGKKKTIQAKILIDATELGDVMAAAGAPYRIGMDSRSDTGEEFAPEKANNIIQDMTYVVTLKDYGKGADKTIAKPAGYNANDFKGSCDVSDPAAFGSADNNCYQMMQYGRLPNDKYMINWPKFGNDIYLNIIEKSPAERAVALKEAKLHTLRFLYYLQTELGYKQLGIADEYPTKDKLPMIPYHRESRRVKGLVTLTLNHVAKPYDQKEALYRTGIAVGDYTIDHHHLKNPSAPKIDFVKIKVPSYNVPLGSLIPESTEGLIVAEKSISVSNIVNGATRLQPVVLTIGQAAGALAATAIKDNVQPAQVHIRHVQQALLNSKGYLMPFIDVKPEDKDFQAIQRIGTTGILKGTGLAYKWANQTWFYPDREISEHELVTGLKTYYPELNQVQASGQPLTLNFLAEQISLINKQVQLDKIISETGSSLRGDSALNRRQTAVLLDRYLNPFSLKVNFTGAIIR
ncbi:FAD-dependent oxidoreductase [Desertivirga arenae]|uniref:FAD-dependent oxidoreductase n=1 Tax=Desertivirga arenae TaxID=2810309 RepID=UPI001A97010D|nr:FAD-dependent oxidoreductase [Pedobacter sp. SYSU D00823]